MNVERLRKIIAYSSDHLLDIETKVKKFYSYTGLNYDSDVLNVLQIIRPALEKKGYIVLELPFADNEIGALCYRGDALGYILLNTSLPKVNVNFAICHELYHVFFREDEFQSRAEFSNDLYYESEEEIAANLFAGMLLMPETNYRNMYGIFYAESDGNEKDTIIRLMNYYQVPYMAALVRCYELDLQKSNSVDEELLHYNQTEIRSRCVDLWLDQTILDATKKDDYRHMEVIVERFGNDYVKENYINERTLKRVLQNMRALYKVIKGE